MSEAPNDSRKEDFPAHISVPKQESESSSMIGAVLSFFCIVLLAFILRLAVPQEDNAIELGILLIAVGFSQVWLIFHFLKSFRK